MNRPQRIVMLAYPDSQILDVTGPMQMFAGVNEELNRSAYALLIAAPKRGPFKTSSGLRLVADLAVADINPAILRRTDTLIAAGGNLGLRSALEGGEITALIKDAYKCGLRIASVCTGAFFLAAAGVLDGRRAATHWRAVTRLREFRPQVDVDPEAIHVRDGNVWTSAGVTAGIDLALAMVEADHGRAVALAVARRHVVFRIRPGGQSQFSPELAAQSARDDRLVNLAEKIATEPAQNWQTDALATEAGMSLRSLHRLFRKELNTSPSEFVERVRIDQARRALLETDAAIETVAVRCGFGSLRRMDRAFARVISATPTEFRARFRATGVPS
ncbi:MAG: GlxA family transcriptional regulator [Rhodospirillales bacterium]